MTLIQRRRYLVFSRWAVPAGVLFSATNAWAIPCAAAAASPPVVVGGVLVGVLLLGLSVGILLRTFRMMKASRVERTIERLRREADARHDHWLATRDAGAIGGLIELMMEADGDDERHLLSNALSDITGRYFGPDAIAWQAWWTHEGKEFVATALSKERREPPAGKFLPVS